MKLVPGVRGVVGCGQSFMLLAVDSAGRIGERGSKSSTNGGGSSGTSSNRCCCLPAAARRCCLNGWPRSHRRGRDLAERLAGFGIAFLRIDLRGVGESTNLGRFIPFEQVTAASRAIGFTVLDGRRGRPPLAGLLGPGVDADRLGAVGASYSAEMLAIALWAGGVDRQPIAVAAAVAGFVLRQFACAGRR
ncbi:MAG: hypothetical protein R2882_01035 [Gemmatimonadales bacterium]